MSTQIDWLRNMEFFLVVKYTHFMDDRWCELGNILTILISRLLRWTRLILGFLEYWCFNNLAPYSTRATYKDEQMLRQVTIVSITLGTEPPIQGSCCSVASFSPFCNHHCHHQVKIFLFEPADRELWRTQNLRALCGKAFGPIAIRKSYTACADAVVRNRWWSIKADAWYPDWHSASIAGSSNRRCHSISCCSSNERLS